MARSLGLRRRNIRRYSQTSIHPSMQESAQAQQNECLVKRPVEAKHERTAMQASYAPFRTQGHYKASRARRERLDATGNCLGI